MRIRKDLLPNFRGIPFRKVRAILRAYVDSPSSPAVIGSSAKIMVNPSIVYGLLQEAVDLGWLTPASEVNNFTASLTDLGMSVVWPGDGEPFYPSKLTSPDVSLEPVDATFIAGRWSQLHAVRPVAVRKAMMRFGYAATYANDLVVRPQAGNIVDIELFSSGGASSVPLQAGIGPTFTIKRRIVLSPSKWELVYRLSRDASAADGPVDYFGLQAAVLLMYEADIWRMKTRSVLQGSRIEQISKIEIDPRSYLQSSLRVAFGVAGLRRYRVRCREEYEKLLPKKRSHSGLTQLGSNLQ